MKILVSSDSTYPKFITQHCSYRRLYSIVMYRRLGGDRERKGRWWHTLKRLARALISRLLGFFEPAKRPDDRTDYCLDCSVLLFSVLKLSVLFQASFEPGTSRPLRFAAAPHWLCSVAESEWG